MSENTLEHSLVMGKQTRNDRLSALLTAIIAMAALTLGLVLKEQAASQTWLFESRTAGISARYPAGWLVDERGNYVARMRDPRARPFKTQFIISVAPMSSQSSIRNVLDTLSLQRASDLAAYRTLQVDELTESGVPKVRMSFAFVEADPNPFVQQLPVVALGEDIVTLDGNRAIVATYMASQDGYYAALPAFERFLASLRY